MKMPASIVLLARKGGVGRTSLTMNLAGQFALEGARVLCVDLDGQASLSRVFFGSNYVANLPSELTAAAIFSPHDIEPEQVIHATDFENISVVPAGNGLERYAIPQAINKDGDPYVLRSFLEEVSEHFDLVLIDTPPNTAVATTWAALACSHYVLSPTPPDSFGTQSISGVTAVVTDAATEINPGIRILGYVLNMVQRNSVSEAYINTLRHVHGSQVFDTELPLAVGFREAIAERHPVTHFKPRSKPSKVIKALADEIDSRINSVAGKEAA